MLSVADVDQVLARFVRAYDTGDSKALGALIDPAATSDEGMTFSIAKFYRVFNETSSRHIDLQPIKRVMGEDRASVKLQTRTITERLDVGRQIESGELTVEIRKQGNAALITQFFYRSSPVG
jgi:hypothetical protein